MNPELDLIALRYAGKLFPDFLYIIEDNADYNFVKKDKSVFDDKLIYEYIVNDYRLMNLNKDQTLYIFKYVEESYSEFLQKQWFEFNSLTKLVYKKDNKIKLPEKLHFLNDKNFIEQARFQIEENKLKLIENFKKVKEYIFITRPKELNTPYVYIQSLVNDLTKIKEYSNEEINDYIQKWVDMSVTLDEWLSHKNINLDEELEHWTLEEEKTLEIQQHKFNLFNILKNRIVNNNLIEPFDKIFPIDDKINVAKRDLILIDNLIEGNIDEIKSKRLKEVLHIKNWKITATHFDYIFRHKYIDELNYNIHNENSFLDAYVVLDYKNFLNEFLQEQNNKNEINTSSSSTQPIKYNDESFNQFIKDLEYNYPIYHAPISSYHQWQVNIKYLKQEILSNLIILTDEAKKPYLKKLLFTLQEHYKYVHTVKSDVDELYNSYNTNEHQLLHQMNYTNELHIVLNNEPKKYEFPTEETFKINPFHIQERFYNYHYGVTIREAVDFIKFQEMEYGIREKVEFNPVNILDINKVGNTKNKLNSFKYTNNDSTILPDLMNALITGNFIDKETEIKHFRKIFSGNEIDKQIIWIGNISELSFFIKSIHNIHKKIEDTKQQIWKITSKCFIQSDGTPFDKSKFRGQKLPAKKSIIDNIVNLL